MNISDCAVCRLSNSPEATRVYSDEHYVAFLEPHPDVPGHTVVAPFQHIFAISEASTELQTGLGVAIQQTINKIQSVLKPDGFTVGWNHGAAAGQITPHLHIHILPRWTGDGGGTIHSVIKKENIPFAQIVNKFKQ